MRAEDDTLYETMLKVENKDIFVDLKRNKSGVYLKISERNGSSRNTVLIPISGITKLKKVLDDVSAASETIKVVRSVSILRRKSQASKPILSDAGLLP